MEIQSITPADLKGVLVETTTELVRYEGTDCQISNTSSIQRDLLSGSNLILSPQGIQSSSDEVR